MTRSMFPGSMSGSSPWTFTTIVASDPAHGGPDPVGPRRRGSDEVITARPAGLPDGRGDPLVVGGDEDGVGPAGLHRLAEHPHDERDSRDEVEGFAGEALGAHPRRDHHDRAFRVGHVEW